MYHDIHDENSDIAQRTATRTQVRERLVSGRVDDQKARNLVFLLPVFVHDGGLCLDRIDREVGSTDLLRNTSRFTFLDIGLTNLSKEIVAL